MLYIALSVDEMIFSFFFFPRFDILVDGYNSLDRNSVRYYLLFRARDMPIPAEYGKAALKLLLPPI